MKAQSGIPLLVAFALLLLSLGSQAQTAQPGTLPPAGDVLPFRLLYGNPGKMPGSETACYVWSEGGRLHVRITSDGTPHEVRGELRVTPAGVLKDVSLEESGLRIRQPVPSLLQFDVRTNGEPEELSVVLAGDVEILRVTVGVDGESHADALRIGERQEKPKGLPADLALTGARASWIERFGFN